MAGKGHAHCGTRRGARTHTHPARLHPPRGRRLASGQSPAAPAWPARRLRVALRGLANASGPGRLRVGGAWPVQVPRARAKAASASSCWLRPRGPAPRAAAPRSRSESPTRNLKAGPGRAPREEIGTRRGMDPELELPLPRCHCRAAVAGPGHMQAHRGAHQGYICTSRRCCGPAGKHGELFACQQRRTGPSVAT